MNNRVNTLRVLFYLGWLILFILQAFYTELLDDEAYYWMYSRNLAWGYFDHPPALAVLIKGGSFLFGNELGVRFFIIILSLGTIFLLEKLIQPKDYLLFYIIIASIALFHVGGMLAIPDIPLLFFSITFFHLYRIFLKNTSWYIPLLLGVNMGLMLLSKYHAVLIIFFTILSNIKLLRKRSTWMAGLVAFIVLLPHIYWQYTNDIPSIRYHLFERIPEAYSFAFTIEYLISQPFIFGPFMGIILIITAILYKDQNQFEKALRYNFLGMYLFFFLMTFRGRIEAHWTLLAIIPLMVLGYNYIVDKQRWKKVVYYLFPPALLLIIVLRIYMAWDFVPESYNVRPDFHNSSKWTEAIENVAGDLPVVFINSYQKASKYSFYSGNTAISYNNIQYRKNQFNIWDYEAGLQGQDVMFMLHYKTRDFNSFSTPRGDLTYKRIDNFRSFSNVRINTDEKHLIMNAGDSISLEFNLSYINKNNRDFESNAEYPSYMSYTFLQDKRVKKYMITGLKISNDMLLNRDVLNIMINAPEEQGIYDLAISISTGWLPPLISGKNIKVSIE